LESTKTKSVYEIDEQFRKFLDPLAAHFTSVPEFTNFVAANLRAVVIQRHAQGDTPQAKAWSKAYDVLVFNLHNGQILTNALVDQAVALAEVYLGQVAQEIKVQQARVDDDKDKEIKKLKNALAKAKKKAGDDEQVDPKSSTGGATGGRGRGRGQRGGRGGGRGGG